MKLEITKDEITPHAGLALFGEFIHAMGLPAMIEGELPVPGSGAGYAPSQFIEPLLLMLDGGGRTLEDLRQVLRRALKREERTGYTLDIDVTQIVAEKQDARLAQP